MKIRYVDCSGQVASYPFPTEPKTSSETRQDGERWEVLITPPVQSGGKAHRYRATRRLAADGTVLHLEYRHEITEGWSSYVSRENWAAMTFRGGDDGRFIVHPRRKVPTALYLRWFPAVVEFLHAHDPAVRDGLLQGVRSFRAQQSATARRARERQQHFGQVAHGDVVITRAPIRFNSGRRSRMFVMLEEMDRAGRRRLVPHLLLGDPDSDRPTFCRIRGLRRDELLKVGPAAFAEAPAMTAHEKLHALTLARIMRDRVAAGTLS